MTYALVSIVKDEAERIVRMLESAKLLISHWTVIDTGSSDDTPQLVQSALVGIPGRLLHLPFVNFGHNRSEVFALAHGTADWLLALDADMTIEIDPDFEPDPAVDAYMVRMGTDDFAYRLPLVLNGRRQWKSVGACHEYTTLVEDRPYVGVPTDAVRVTYEHRSSPEKTAWQASLLEAELARQPENARSTFYLAQTYREMGRLGEARDLYYRRAAMGGFAEEAFYAAYRAALLESEWPDRLAALIRAWEMRPGRIEPIHEIARELNARGEHHSAYRFASLPFGPTQDILFVHRWCWDWGMAFERSIAAWWIGHNDEALALNDSLQANPVLPAHVRQRVDENRAFCIMGLVGVAGVG